MNWKAIFECAEKIMNEYDPDPDHARQVRRLALILFDQLAPLHAMNQNDSLPDALSPRQILELSATMHDIGWSLPGSRGHHKKSRSLILETDFPGLSDAQRGRVAMIARYHRKRPPDASRHYAFAELGPDDQDMIRWLSGILRVADGLDRAHTADVEHLSCHIEDATITIVIQCVAGFATAVYGANRKKELLETVSGRNVVITP